MFDPYFSTKKKGSGLGLATAYSIIKNHDGLITVDSELGVGTTFYFYLPVSKKGIEERKSLEEKLISGQGKVLIMDDEELVRDVTGRMLERIGYEIEFSNDGTEAVEIYKKAQESNRPFDAVILDLTVAGGMGGKEAIKKLKDVDPEVKSIVSSGYSTDPIMSEYKQYGFSGVIVKPYEIKELSEALHKVIEGE
ncbi:MAG: response regulator [Candidatus Euphemobacter frigidus]|nr:response regulator [Candidatus Euphemobacter frigidus]